MRRVERKNYQKWSIPTQQWCEWVKNLWFHSNLVNECLVACMVRLRSLDWLASLNSHLSRVCKRRRKQYSHILIRSRLNLPKTKRHEAKIYFNKRLSLILFIEPPRIETTSLKTSPIHSLVAGWMKLMSCGIFPTHCRSFNVINWFRLISVYSIIKF